MFLFYMESITAPKYLIILFKIPSPLSKGLKRIGERVNQLAQILTQNLALLGYNLLFPSSQNCFLFDTISLKEGKEGCEKLFAFFLKNDINIRKVDDNIVSLSLDETTTMEDVSELIRLFGEFKGKNVQVEEAFYPQNYKIKPFESNLIRKSTFMKQQIFNSIHSETQMLRFIRNISKKDISLAKSMIPLGSCTMKLNSSSEMVKN